MDDELNEKDTEIERLRGFYESKLAESTRMFEEEILRLNCRLLKNEQHYIEAEDMTEYIYKHQLAEKEKELNVSNTRVDFIKEQLKYLRDMLFDWHRFSPTEGNTTAKNNTLMMTTIDYV